MNTNTATYRKTKSGQWVVYAPVAKLRAGQPIKVTKANGMADTKVLQSVGKAFVVDGTPMAYGYMAGQSPKSHSGRSHHQSWSCSTGGNCSSFGSGRSCGAHDCDGW